MALDPRNKIDQRDFAAMQQVSGVAATATQAGPVKKGAAVANCTVAADGTSAGTQLNALLTSLRNAGIIS